MRAARRAQIAIAVVIVGSIAISTLISCTSLSAISPADIRATDDPAKIERGRYLVYGPAHCVACHGDPAQEGERRAGRPIPLSGGRSFDLGVLGIVVAPNITSDPVAGIGALSDETLVRSLRYGISRHGEPLAPFMSFAELSDDDLQAVLSFLRTVPPVPRLAPETDLSWLGAFGVRFVIGPQGPAVRPPAHATPERTAEYGRYLAHTVANCHGCHTRRSKLTGAFVGPLFAGGTPMDEAMGTFVPPNLTPIDTGIVKACNEQQFIDRFRVEGRRLYGSPMPWEEFARMTDTDLGAIYRYLSALPPVASQRHEFMREPIPTEARATAPDAVRTPAAF